MISVQPHFSPIPVRLWSVHSRQCSAPVARSADAPFQKLDEPQRNFKSPASRSRSPTARRPPPRPRMATPTRPASPARSAHYAWLYSQGVRPARTLEEPWRVGGDCARIDVYAPGGGLGQVPAAVPAARLAQRTNRLASAGIARLYCRAHARDGSAVVRLGRALAARRMRVRGAHGGRLARVRAGLPRCDPPGGCWLAR